jgi:mannose-6-phosphate isomerase-like protein (cupin superfamily)
VLHIKRLMQYLGWVGGPPGFIHPNRGVAPVSENTVVGMMNLPVGQRQKGLHYHSVTEIYVILRGELEGYDGRGQTHRAGPGDCMYIPKGVPHGVRNCGTEDCDLIWVHDGIEKIGTSVYYMDGIVTGPPQVEDISIIYYKDLEPSYAAHRAKEIGCMRSIVSWVAGPDGHENFNRGVATESDKVAIGMTVLQPAQKSVPHTHENAEVYVVMSGKAVINLGKGNEEINKLDGVYIPAGNVHSVRNHGHEPLCIMWVSERPEKLGATQYKD